MTATAATAEEKNGLVSLSSAHAVEEVAIAAADEQAILVDNLGV